MSGAKVIDARGSFCPGPLMELIAAMKLAEVGEDLEVLSTDKGSANDIPEWIAKVGHEMVGNFEENGVYHIQVRKMK
ncbi:MAG: sulfurtransferase TusA family protein [Gammaproteobacteria bacterium]|nr:sulfurtransferase TusA family protein [Gammaproteobacteria bacterium]